MAYTVPGLSVNQVTPQQSAVVNLPNVRTIAVIGTFPIGPALARIDPSQTTSVYGDPANPQYAGFSGPQAMKMAAQQTSNNKAYSLSLIGVRVGTAAATAQLADSSSGHPFTLSGIGAYTGSKGNFLQVVVSAPNIAVSEITKGGFGANEVQQITFYGVGTGATYSTLPVLSFAGTPAGSTLALASAKSASLLQTYLNGITTISAGSGSVTVTALPQPTVGAYSYAITFAGGALAGTLQPLIAVSTAAVIATPSGTIAVQSILMNDTSSGSPVTKQTYTAGQYDLSTNGAIAAAITAQNDPNSSASSVSVSSLSSSAGLPATQTASFAGGTDGLGASASDATIAPLLATLASGVLGNVDFVVAGFDAAAILPALQTFTTSALANNIFPKHILGPAAGTTYSSLTGTYQTANSDRVVIIGHDSMVGTNPTNGTLNTHVHGYHVAAAVAGAKAITDAPQNLYAQALAGIAARTPVVPDTSTTITTAQLSTLAAAGYTTFRYDSKAGAQVVRDLITTAPQTDQYGQPNRFLRLNARDNFDMIALSLVAGFANQVQAPTDAPASVVAALQSVANSVMLSSKGRYHNGATALVSFDPVASAVTVNIGYGDRQSIASITINLGVLPGFSN